MIPLPIVLAGIITAASDTSSQRPECDTCDFRVFEVFTKADHPAPNIALVQFQYKCEDDGCAENIGNDELMRLQAALAPITVSAFAKSKKSFWFMVKYALTRNQPATIEMKASIPQTENEELKAYYDEAANLVEYHSKKGAVEVLFRYEVNSPPQGFGDD